ncbi:AAA family ATPase [Williamsia sterculiae]|uniref:C-terminal, D2-small domain-containing protein, of ClpB protein n=1 Tax=Williamsia sterculiae TaxID=1344003 RepID=A0A1N7GL30_9NOCA|nr:AAA family ATPase [Williamsia sterculiae]SIS13239.1 C-terminal, D2-small domain-containing protein, of ClpB protein [Williamsia sterculiae]
MSGYLTQKLHDLDPLPDFRLGDARSPDTLRDRLRSAVIGQDDAVDAVVRALTISAAGIRDPYRPVASLLFVGPTGVGKTELARQIAAEVRGDPDNLCRIDMNALAQEHYSASLSGSPPGYAGSKEQFSLFQRDRIEGTVSRPGVVLFDEVEKAHTTVLRALLQILDTGTLRLAAGTSTIDFRNCIVLLTSNLGSRDIARDRMQPLRSRLRTGVDRIRGAPAGDRATVATAVERFFDPELFNRFDEVVYFDALDRTSAAAIVDAQIASLTAQLRGRDVICTIDDGARAEILDAGFDRTYGARNLHRTLRSMLYAVVADVIVRHRASTDHPLRLRVSVVGGALVCVPDAER